MNLLIADITIFLIIVKAVGIAFFPLSESTSATDNDCPSNQRYYGRWFMISIYVLYSILLYSMRL